MIEKPRGTSNDNTLSDQAEPWAHDWRCDLADATANAAVPLYVALHIHYGKERADLCLLPPTFSFWLLHKLQANVRIMSSYSESGDTAVILLTSAATTGAFSWSFHIIFLENSQILFDMNLLKSSF